MTSVPVYNGRAARAHLKYPPPPSNPLSGDSQQPLPPPPYQKQAQVSPLQTLLAGSTEATAGPPPATSTAALCHVPFSPHFRAHSIIGIYKVSHSDMTLALSATDANPLSYISTHSYARPHLELRATGSPKSPILATAEFRHFSSSTTVSASSAAGPVTQQLDKEGGFFVGSPTWAIDMVVLASGVRERFEWRRSSAVDVQMLEGRRKGWSFERVATGEVMAVYAGVSGWSTKKVGKFRWLGGRGGATDVGDVGELLCVTSLLALLEKARRSRNRSSAGASAGGAGGFSGRGGC